MPRADECETGPTAATDAVGPDLPAEPVWLLAADRGGTFTDCCGLDPEGRRHRAKLLSSGRLRSAWHPLPETCSVALAMPGNHPEGFFAGWTAKVFQPGPATEPAWTARVSGSTGTVLHFAGPVPLGFPSGAFLELDTGEPAPVMGARLLTGTRLGEPFPPHRFRLATTLATNALLENQGAAVAFFVTRGFSDLLVIGDQRRPDLFALQHQRDRPLHQHTVQVVERLDAAGKVLIPPDLEKLAIEARDLVRLGVTTAAVALAHSDVNPANEQAVRAVLVGAGFTTISLGSTLSAEIRLLPRAQTAVVDAALDPVIRVFVQEVRAALGAECLSFHCLTSAGGLAVPEVFHAKDSLLSGPAGGIAGCAAAAADVTAGLQAARSRTGGFQTLAPNADGCASSGTSVLPTPADPSLLHLLTLDMGGTSTDTARWEGEFLYQFEQRLGQSTILAPSLRIETVAAGGGSICSVVAGALTVGPRSAGADPGPACYGRGGPLTLTDVNLLLGRLDPDKAGIPLQAGPAKAALEALKSAMREQRLPVPPEDATLLSGLLKIAIGRMSEAVRSISVRDGCDPSGYTLLAFGGAGPQHACAIADELGITRILIPADAGLLSASGAAASQPERFGQRQLLQNLGEALWMVPVVAELEDQTLREFGETGSLIRRRLADLRLCGQDTAITLPFTEPTELQTLFTEQFEALYGYPPPPHREMEVVAVRVIASLPSNPPVPEIFPAEPTHCPEDDPLVIQDAFSTLVVEPGWSATRGDAGSWLLHRSETPAAASPADFPLPASNAPDSSPNIITDYRAPGSLPASGTGTGKSPDTPDAKVTAPAEGTENAASTPHPAAGPVSPAQPETCPPGFAAHGASAAVNELFRCRFQGLVDSMGELLRRTSVSTNVKERLDYSCALLDASGHLLLNAPHIPVHLGALGECVRRSTALLPPGPGDVLVTNDPAFGGSHLPDVTVIRPIFGASGKLLAFTANRAHHAEIGGITPGSMPAFAKNLAEEGVVISPMFLIREGISQEESVAALLASAPWPTRALPDNLADLRAQAAAAHHGARALLALSAVHGEETIRHQLSQLTHQARQALSRTLAAATLTEVTATERLDDGTPVQVRLAKKGDRLTVDFTGSGGVHPGNRNATPAVVRSAVLYVLRLWTGEPIPLNEGFLEAVDLILPPGFLNPPFSSDPAKSPAVVGGNVETSQRIVDTLIRALGIQAGSQGTMNNVIFGNSTFGHYETVCGGSGAGPGYAGTDAIHTHMTNTAITDIEILERRYPVRVEEFGIRRGSGGERRFAGGCGAVRVYHFLAPVSLSLLTEHRSSPPAGMDGGEPGSCGLQFLILPDGTRSSLPGTVSLAVEPGTRLHLHTPGGGGWGKFPDSDIAATSADVAAGAENSR